MIEQSPENVLEREISLFKHGKETRNPEYITIKKLLDNIRIGTYKQSIEKARRILQSEGKEKYKAFKESKIPGFTLSAKTKHRISDTKATDSEKNNKLLYHTGILQIDIDGIQDLPASREKIIADKHTVFCFTSISGTGLKAGIPIDGTKHKESFNQAEKYYLESYGIKIDKACKDVYRLCFVSYDTDLFINENPEPFIYQEPKAVQKNEVSSKFQKPKLNGTGVSADKHERLKKLKINNLLKYLERAAPGERHLIRNKAAYIAGGLVAGGVCNDAEILPKILELSDIKSDNGKTNDTELQTIQDGFEAGKLRPIYFDTELQNYETWINQNGYRKAGPGKNVVHVVSKETGEIITSIPESRIWESLGNDERGDSELLAELIKDISTYVHNEKSWYLYNGSIWKKDSTQQTRKFAISKLYDSYQALYDKIELNLKDLTRQATIDGNDNKSKIETLEKHRSIVHNRLKKLNTKNRINNVLDLSTSHLPSIITDFDSNRYLLNLKNGIYDLKNNKFFIHSPKYKFKKIAGTHYEPKAICSDWILFLDKIFDTNPELIKFVQTLCGVWLSGTADLQHLVFAYGSGANGKSTFFNAMQLLLNGIDTNGNLNSEGYFIKISIETLLQKRFQDSTDQYSLARLYGARLAIASEIPKNSRLNEALVKDLTGGESFQARHIYGSPFEFSPSHKLVMFGNTKPIVKDSSEGFWRRMILIPFTITIPENERRKQSEIINDFKNELPGILNWCLEGWRRYQNEGLLIPDIVRAATKEYQIESDILAEFFDDNKERYTINLNDRSLRTKAENLHSHFVSWCQANTDERENPFKSNKGFYKALREKGFKTDKYTDNKLFVFGINENDKLL